MSAHASTARATKKSAFSCEQCRKRKVKCDGQQPRCSRCSTRDEPCIYKQSPTLSYTQRLENRIKELEGLLAESKPSSQGSNLSKSASPIASSQFNLSEEVGVPEVLNAFEGLKLDHEGGITYHGATSFFQLPSHTPDSAASDTNPWARNLVQGSQDDNPQRRARLVHNAWQQRALETLSETPEPFQSLLDHHWCWIQPLFNFIYRPAFTRDMEVLGPYYSHTLLNAVLAHSVRWCKDDERIRPLLEPYDNGALFGRQAHTLLFEELSHGNCKVPTVQSLLLLSAQECSRGNRTQAWLYSGMAFRLIEDMGITIDGQKYAGSVRLSDEDVEIRNRLFWSCYLWDKLISLYLGRSPTLQYSLVSPPQIMLDDSAENDLWTPYGIECPNYPPTQAHSISCFVRMAQLTVIFNQILIHIYDPIRQNTENEIRACLHQEGESLRLWWDELPQYLRIEAKDLPPLSPPSHIVTMNCLYHTFKILLYRPMLFRKTCRIEGTEGPDPRHLIECVASATSIIAIIDLFCRSFGDGHCILALSYSIYTASSIFLLQLQAATSQDVMTLRRMEFCIGALRKVQKANLVIGSALALLNQELAKLDIHIDQDPSPHTATTTTTEEVDSEARLGQSNFLPSTATLHQVPSFLNGTQSMYQPPLSSDFSLESFQISPEMFENFSTLEPISSHVGALHDTEWKG